MMRNGKKLSQGEARRTFSQYLGCVLKRITSTQTPDQEGHVEIVLKFLEKASNYLRTPFPIKVSMAYSNVLLFGFIMNQMVLTFIFVFRILVTN